VTRKIFRELPSCVLVYGFLSVTRSEGEKIKRILSTWRKQLKSNTEPFVHKLIQYTHLRLWLLFDNFPAYFHMKTRHAFPISIFRDWSSGTFVFGRCWFRISAGTPAILTEVVPGIPQSLQANACTVSQSGHRHFLQSRFQFNIHLSFYHCTVLNSVLPTSWSLCTILNSRWTLSSTFFFQVLRRDTNCKTNKKIRVRSSMSAFTLSFNT
jgi:hypothetical protein